MVDWIKCVPFVGTAISAVETVKAVADGNGKKVLWKLGETAIGGAMDALTVVSLGTSAIASTSAKTAAKVAVSAAAKNVAGATLVRAVGTTVAGKEAEKCVSSGGTGGGGDRNWKKEKGSHERENDNEESPITKVEKDSRGRVSKLYAKILRKHLRSGERKGAGYSTAVRNYVKSMLDMENGDEIGHIIAWCLGGPYNNVNNYFPQHPRSNRQFYHELEKKIQDFLKANPNGCVHILVEVWYAKNSANKRPIAMEYTISFWENETDVIHSDLDNIYWENNDRNLLSKPEYRKYDKK